MVKRLDHPALPRIVDIIDNGSTIYIVMDFIEGESLDKILNEYGAQPEDKVIEWAIDNTKRHSYERLVEFYILPDDATYWAKLSSKFNK